MIILFLLEIEIVIFNENKSFVLKLQYRFNNIDIISQVFSINRWIFNDFNDKITLYVQRITHIAFQLKINKHYEISVKIIPNNSLFNSVNI